MKARSKPKRPSLTRLVFHLVVSAAVIVLSLAVFVYPAATICRVMWDSQLRTTGQSRIVPGWFESASGRYLSWAEHYLDTDYAASLYHNDIAPTEWPMFGSAFYLVTAEDLHTQGKIDASEGTIAKAIEKAAEVVASPVTATWVRTKWGDKYLEQENVFYRMLLILGLSSYERITGNTQYHALMSQQRSTLAEELAQAKLHLRDDYPGECYPADMLWAVAAIQRAARLEGTRHDELAAGLVAAFDGPLKTEEGLPVFMADSRTGQPIQGARGCANSGILLFTAELDPAVAQRWYTDYEEHFWKDTGWLIGFSEMPRGTDSQFMDVDSGPVVFDVGFVSSAFGIGAARSVGRFDHAAPLTMEAVACSWPTPFGPIIPGIMGKLGADSWSLGEVAMLFSMTRPCHAAQTVPFDGSAPGIVWVLLVVYAGVGTLSIWFELHTCRRAFRRYRQRESNPSCDTEGSPEGVRGTRHLGTRCLTRFGAAYRARRARTT